MRQVPETRRNADWDRKVSQAVRDLVSALKAQQEATDWGALDNYADDTAAAAGGVEVGSLYRTGSTLKVRVS